MSQEEAETETASEYVTCPVCQQPVKSKGRYGHFKTAHPELNYQEYKGKFKSAPVPEGREPAREAPLYKGELDTTSILKDILKRHPDIPAKVVDEVCSWAEFGPIHPTQLVSLLQSFRGITATTAYIVAQKYALALQKAQQEGKLQMPPLVAGPMPAAQPPQWGFPTGFPQQQLPTGLTQQQPQTSYAPQFGAPQPPGWYPQPPQDIRSVVREELRASREPREAEAYVDIEEPVRDAEGKVIIGPDDRAIVKRMHMPTSQASQFVPREDVEMKVLEKLKTYKELFGPKEELTETKIREIIRQETPTPPPKEEKNPITIEDVQKVSSESAQSVAKQILEAREKEDKEERRHQEVIRAIQSSASAKAVEGYKEDSYRILGQGMSELGGAIKERKPVEVLVREGGSLILGERPSKEVEVGAGKGLIERLKERGWVTES